MAAVDDEEKTRLLQSIDREDEFFTSIIDCIPPEHYGFDSDVKEILKDRKHTLVDEKLTQDQRSKLSNKLKGRLARLDDRQCRTNSQIFAYLLQMRKMVKKGDNKKRRNEDDASPSKKKVKVEKSDWLKQRLAKKTKTGGMMNGGGNQNRQQLLGKLQAKLDEMRAKRGTSKATATQGIDYEEKKRIKRRLSKAKMKERRRQGKGGVVKTDVDDGDHEKKVTGVSDKSKSLTNGQPASSKSNSQQEKTAIGIQAKKRKVSTTAPTSTPSTKRPALVDRDGKMVFSKFDFAVPGVVEDSGQDKWAKKNSGKDYKRLLEKQEKLQGKVRRLEENDDEAGAAKLKEKVRWDAAAQRAKGGKVKDDTNLLKKNLKRKEKRKQQTKRKWDTRIEGVEKKKQEQQNKRQGNIQAKKRDQKEKKLTKARKKGRLV